MSITFEAAPQGEAVAPQQEAITSKAGERLRGGADFISSAASRLADRLDARAQAKAQHETPSIDMSPFEAQMDQPDSPEDGHEKESRGKAFVNRIGVNALGALRATGELAVGSGILAGRAAKRGGEYAADKVTDTADRFRVQTVEVAGRVKSEIIADVQHLKSEALERKQARLDARAERKTQRAEEREARQSEKAAEKEVRAKAAEARRDARRSQWRARKESISLALSSAETAVSDKIAAAASRVMDMSKEVAEKAAEVRETAVSAATNTYEAGKNKAEAAIIATSRGAATAVENSRDVYRAGAEKSRRGAEWLKSRVDDTRAVGSAALDAAAQARRTLQDQRAIGQ